MIARDSQRAFPARTIYRAMHGNHAVLMAAGFGDVGTSGEAGLSSH